MMQKKVYSTKTDLASQCKFKVVRLHILALSEVLSGLNIHRCRVLYDTFGKLSKTWMTA